MGYSGEAAEQVVKMSLNGIEIAAKISGVAAERLATLLYAVLKDQKRTKGKVRIASMLRSGKELKVFAVKDSELSRFCSEAKRYGVLYCALKDNKAGDGLTDIMVRAEDASKVNRIFERFKLATIDMGSVKTEIEKSREDKTPEEPAREDAVKNRIDEFLDRVVPEEPKKEESVNPSSARTQESRQSGTSSRNSRTQDGGSAIEPGERPSVRKEMENIRKEMESGKASKEKTKDMGNRHIAPPKKKGRRKEVSL